MDKDTIKRLIIEYQQFVANITLIEREIHLSHQLNYVFVGLRRAGKSYLMYQQIQSLLNDGHQPEEILYFNFEDDRLVNLTVEDLDLIKVSYEELYPHKPIFFLDEIQIVEHWEKFARRLADQQYRLISCPSFVMISIFSFPGFFTIVKSSLENISVMLKRVTRATISATAKTMATSKRFATVPIGSESVWL